MRCVDKYLHDYGLNDSLATMSKRLVRIREPRGGDDILVVTRPKRLGFASMDVL